MAEAAPRSAYVFDPALGLHVKKPITGDPIELPLWLQAEEYRFIKLGYHSKRPLEAWTEPQHQYAADDPGFREHLQKGYNYGILPGHRGLAIFDVDNLKRLWELGAVQPFLLCYQVRTGSGGLHIYFETSGIEGKWILRDPKRKDDEGGPLHLGEVFFGGNFFVVGPGSVHPNGRTYEPLKNCLFLKFPAEKLREIFGPLLAPAEEAPAPAPKAARAPRSGGSLVDALGLCVEEFLYPVGRVRRSGNSIQGEHPEHPGSKNQSNLSIDTAKNVWYCHRCKSGGGPLEALAVVEGIIDCSEAGPGCLEGKWKEIFEALESRGYDLGRR
ncbi:MAG: bifunctional DNA primase/polymerase [Methanomicrobiales archaeon]|nr:bifunctional DNA primase/polymerase [Methanomicrobiales archaeon]